jgi:hypothetical protein
MSHFGGHCCGDRVRRNPVKGPFNRSRGTRGVSAAVEEDSHRDGNVVNPSLGDDSCFTTSNKQQVQNSIRDNIPTKSIKVVAAHQLKSGDLLIFARRAQRSNNSTEHRIWLKGLGDQAEFVVPTYGVIVHSISTKSINIKDQKATIQQMLADNYTQC